MGLKDTSKSIKNFVVNDRKAFLEISHGPPLSQKISFDKDSIALPLGSSGNQTNIDFGCRLLGYLGIPTDTNFRKAPAVSLFDKPGG